MIQPPGAPPIPGAPVPAATPTPQVVVPVTVVRVNDQTLIMPSTSHDAAPAVAPDADTRAAAAETYLAQLANAPALQANAVTAIWGDSGSGKTALVCTAIEYAWETYHRTSRVYAGDLGGFGNKLLSLIRLGLAEVWNLYNHVEAFETVELASLGYWPEQILDKETGYADPYVRLIPPQRRTYVVYCPNGHAFPDLGDKRQLTMFQGQCPTCQTITTLQNLSKVEERVVRSKGFRHVGLYCYESGTSLQDLIMNDMADRAGRDELGGEKGVINKIVSGSLTFGSNNRAHYGFAQTRVRQWIANSRKIPGQVVPPIWTFLADRGSDQASAPVWGPKVAGGAKTSEVPGWVGNCLHTEKAKDENSGKDVWRVWLTGHRNPAEGNVLYLAKHRAEPGTFQQPYLQDAATEPAFTKFSMAYFFRAIDASFTTSVKRDMERFPDAPALKPLADEDEEVVTTPLSTGQVTGMAAAPSPSIGGVPAAAFVPPLAGMPAGGPAGGFQMPGAPVMMPGAPVLGGPLAPPPGAPPITSALALATTNPQPVATPVQQAMPESFKSFVVPNPEAQGTALVNTAPNQPFPSGPPIMPVGKAPARPPVPGKKS